MLRSTAGSALKMHCEFTQGREETGETEEIAGKESFSSGWWLVWQHVEIGAHPGLQIEHFTMKNISPTFLCFFSSSTWHHGGSWTKIRKHTQRSASSKAATNLALMPGNRNCWAATWPLLMWNIVFLLKVFGFVLPWNQVSCMFGTGVVAESSEMMLWVRSLMLRYVICYVCKISTKNQVQVVFLHWACLVGPVAWGSFLELMIISCFGLCWWRWLLFLFRRHSARKDVIFFENDDATYQSALLVESSFISSFLLRAKCKKTFR